MSVEKCLKSVDFFSKLITLLVTYKDDKFDRYSKKLYILHCIVKENTKERMEKPLLAPDASELDRQFPPYASPRLQK